MQRRQFLILSGSSLASVLLSKCATPQTQSNASSMSTVFKSQEGRLDVDLDMSSSLFSLGGEQGNLLSYNQQIPGPRLEARPGDQVRIRATNRLSAPTNLHYHGLHISPKGSADNIFLKLSPGESYIYEFTIPKNHYSTTAYYHPHFHGYVAQQVFGGLGGIFVVRGALDEIPEIKQAKEEFIFLKDFDVNVATERSQPFQRMQMMGREGSTVTVNGRVNPELSISAGGLLRLRFVNASTSRFYNLQLEGHSFYLIATDAGATSSPIELSELLLSPGERAEVLVKGNAQPSNYRLLNLPYQRGGMGMMGRGMMGRGRMGHHGMRRGQPNRETSSQTLATLTYSGEVEPLSLPQKLIPVEELPEPQTKRQFTLNHGMIPGRGMQFLINGQVFDSQRTDTRAFLDTVEEWEISNTGVMDHPFHLHTNRFQAVSRNGQPLPYRTWKDTVLVPRGETVRIRIPFRDFVGKTVYHCHILDHEDLGMMGTIALQA